MYVIGIDTKIEVIVASRTTWVSYQIQWNLSITTTEWETCLPSGAHLGGKGTPRWAPEGRNC